MFKKRNGMKWSKIFDIFFSFMFCQEIPSELYVLAFGFLSGFSFILAPCFKLLLIVLNVWFDLLFGLLSNVIGNISPLTLVLVHLPFKLSFHVTLGGLFVKCPQLILLSFWNLLHPRLFSWLFHGSSCGLELRDVENWYFLQDL